MTERLRVPHGFLDGLDLMLSATAIALRGMVDEVNDAR